MSSFIRNAAGLMAEGKGTMLNHRLALKAPAQRRQLLPLVFHCQSKSYGQVCSNEEGK